MKGPLITIIAGFIAMQGGYFAAEFFDERGYWIPMAISYLFVIGGLFAEICGLVWGAYRLVRGKRWRP